jgi:hypothetical protein
VEHYVRLLQEATALFIVLWCISVAILIATVVACALVYTLIRRGTKDCTG